MKLERAERHFRALLVGILIKKVSGNFSDYEERYSGKKFKKNEEKKISYRTFSLAVFLFTLIKRGKKVSGFVFYR